MSIEHLKYRTMRSPTCSELNQIFMLGYDVWSGGEEHSDYLVDCHASEKYTRGTWQVLDTGIEIVSAVIVYTDGFNLPSGACGIGSLATSPQYRRREYGSDVMRRTVVEMTMRGFSSVYLFSDIHVSFYERLGFNVVGRSGEEVCMRYPEGDVKAFPGLEIGYF